MNVLQTLKPTLGRVGNIVEKGENAGYQTMFSKVVLHFAIKGYKLLKPFPNKPWFLCVCSLSLLKTMQEKEKLLVTSNFSFSTVLTTPLENLLPSSSTTKLSSANCFSLEESKIGRLGKG